MVRTKDLGPLLLGDFRVRLIVTEEWGGSFYFAYAGSLPRIEVGTASGKWESIISALLHEAFEFELARLGYRFSRSNDFGNDHSEYTFAFNHPQFSDLCGRVAVFVSAALPKVAKAWKELKEESRCKDRKAKRTKKSGKR